MPKLTPEEARAYVARYEIVREYEIEELRAMTAEEKIRQLEVLYRAIDELGWHERLKAEAKKEEVWATWAKIREVLG